MGRTKWDPTLFQFPCQCCGSRSHSLLHHKLDRLGIYEEAKFSCPLIGHNDVYDMLEESLMSRKYEPDPSKIASYCFYDSERVRILIGEIKRNGAGRHMENDHLEYIEKEAIEECTLTRGNWRFKRFSNGDEFSDDDC